MLNWRRRNLLTTDLSTAGYLILTGILILIFQEKLAHSLVHLLFRLGIILLITVLVYLQRKKANKFIRFIQSFYPFVLLAYTFGETAYLNHLFFQHSFDSIIIHWELVLFGSQPSIEFSRHFPEHWFAELLNFSYLSYYFMTLGLALVYYFRYPQEAEKMIFIIITSLYIYYLIFILIPTEGPQYYLPAPLNQAIRSGIFSDLVQFVEHYGDKPTGAFPSSHVGMSFIYLILTYRKLPKLFWLLLPFVLLICMATVYIKAHYALDVIGGMVSAPLIYLVARWMHTKIVNP